MAFFRPDLSYNRGNYCVHVVGPILGFVLGSGGGGVHGEFINGLVEVSSSLVVLSLGFKTNIALLSLWVQVEVEGLIGIVGSAN